MDISLLFFFKTVDELYIRAQKKIYLIPNNLKKKRERERKKERESNESIKFKS